MSVIPIQSMIQKSTHETRRPHNPAYRAGAAFSGGKYVPIHEATVPLLDGIVQGGDGCYESISVYQGQLFRLDDHLMRFAQSSQKFQLKSPYTRDQIIEIISTMVKLTGLQDAFVWLGLTRGVQAGNREIVVRYRTSELVNQFYGYACPYLTISNDEQRARGLNIAISKTRKISPSAVDSTAKNFMHMDGRMALIEAMHGGYEWATMLDEQGDLAESPGANIFVLKDRVLYTPESACLLGITRRTVFELCEELGIRVVVGRVPAQMLLEADEAFLTSTGGGIMPINRVDNTLLGGVEGPGELSIKLHNMYWQKRKDGWHGTRIEY